MNHGDEHCLKFMKNQYNVRLWCKPFISTDFNFIVLSPSDLNNAVYFGSFTMSKTFGWINMDGMLETK